MKILISGAGIGGLSAAIGLSRLGLDVEIFEASTELRTTGAGLNLWPNAGRAIYGLGLKDEYNAISVKLDRYLNFNTDGKLLFRKETADWPEKFGVGAVGLYRRSLNRMLAEALGMQRIRFGCEVVSAENVGDGVICHLSNGEHVRGDCLIGADGIYSATRRSLIGEMPLRENDHHAYRWRAIFPLKNVDVDPAAQTGFYCPEGFVSIIPIGNDKAYWFGSIAGAKSIDEFVDFCSGWKHTPISDLIGNTPRESIIENHLDDVDGIPYRWTHGRITLIGDAAHPLMPDLAQGASQTVIDSLVLRDVFSETEDIGYALREYERRRRPTALHIVKCSQKGSYLGRNSVDPIAVRYEREVEGFDGIRR